MAASPRYKLHAPNGEYVASSKQPELLAACIGLLGAGATIRDGRSSKTLILWTEGDSTAEEPGGDGIGCESYDAVAEACYARQDARFDS